MVLISLVAGNVPVHNDGCLMERRLPFKRTQEATQYGQVTNRIEDAHVSEIAPEIYIYTHGNDKDDEDDDDDDDDDDDVRLVGAFRFNPQQHADPHHWGSPIHLETQLRTLWLKSAPTISRFPARHGESPAAGWMI